MAPKRDSSDTTASAGKKVKRGQGPRNEHLGYRLTLRPEVELNETVEFYKNVLGAHIEEISRNNLYEMWIGGTRFVVQSQSHEHTTRATGRVNFCIEMRNAQDHASFLTRASAAGATTDTNYVDELCNGPVAKIVDPHGAYSWLICVRGNEKHVALTPAEYETCCADDAVVRDESLLSIVT